MLSSMTHDKFSFEKERLQSDSTYIGFQKQACLFSVFQSAVSRRFFIFEPLTHTKYSLWKKL
jgi:hypothetical protein